ncbi:MAG: malonyl-CoA synthase [Geminicoccaceae bacterium]|nr:malonyl-CoA synthase [Geminicoccaceae bacterium]MCX8102247.1 malonyl-CoA synthase [Geminicoccaceae bacterium]MDW8371244.1 malonyl-CoA synthase [Geminicoccaceae bacterium]
MDEALFATLRAGFAGRERERFLETPDGRVWTFSDLLDRSAAYARMLQGFGLEPGDRVAVQVEKSPENLFLYLGCIRAGGVYLPLNTAYTLAELDYFLADAEPKVVVVRPGLVEEVGKRAPAATILALDEKGHGSAATAADAAAGPFEDVPRAADDLAAILYTSGTTGRSKGAMLTHRNLASNALVLKDYWRVTAADVLLHALPIYHVHGLFTATNTMLAAGGAMLFLAKFDLDEVFRLLPRATLMMGVPTFYTRMLADPRLTREAVAHMRLFVSGSAPLLAETHRAFFERTGHAILERYGMTETGMNSSNPYEGERRPGTVGFPLPGVAIRITDPETGRPLPRGEIGMIEVKGPNVFKGYWKNPEKTAAEFRPDGFFVTGDLGRFDEEGYLSIVGRGKDLVITGGLNVYPKEVEEAIDALPGVVESAVIGVPHPDFGEAVVAVVVAEKGAAITEEAVQRALAERLAAFKRPKRVLLAEELPRNAMGKVQKNVLRERWRDLFATARA